MTYFPLGVRDAGIPTRNGSRRCRESRHNVGRFGEILFGVIDDVIGAE